MSARSPVADDPPTGAAAAGLTATEAARRLRERGAAPTRSTSRSYRSIAIANTFTVFNLILFAFGVATITLGDPRDALFLGIVVANAAIGTFQEIRAKRALDKLAALVAPRATVVRDGVPVEIAPEDVVVDDLVVVRAGHQVVADGRVVVADGLALDESNLTGESEPVLRTPGDAVLSGSFATEGEGRYVATAVGADSRAAQLAETARAFRHPRSPLEKAMDRLLIWLVAGMAPLAIALGVSLALRDVGQAQAVETLTAAVVNIVPEGLILLASLTAAVSAAKMARRGVLAQQLNAIESLASVSVLCTDKTGTLTEASLRVVDVQPAAGVAVDDLKRSFGRYAASAPSRNGTLEAVHAARLGGEAETPRAQVPFSSRRRWSALDLDDERLVLGAPEALLDGDPALAARAGEAAGEGRRVLALVAVAGPLPDAAPDATLPEERRALGIVVLAERLRADATTTVDFLTEEEVALKVLSGDNPATVGAIARDAGIPARGPALDGGALPADAAPLLDAVRAAPAIGRISPEDKARVVGTLADAGEYVGMLGDGVNDVPALKRARLAIAQGSGTEMARSVSDLVLVSGEFSEVPRMVHEGRQILRNIQRVARLFVTKALFTAFMLVAIGLTTGVFPLLPRQFTLTSTFTIGIPAFLLALAPSSGPWRPDHFLKSIARFSIPAGVATGVGIVSSYLVTRYVLDADLEQARTVTTATVVVAGLMIVLALEDEPGKRRLAVGALCAAMALGFVAVVSIPFAREFFDLVPATGTMVLGWAIGAAVTGALLLIALRIVATVERRAGVR